MTSMDSFSVLLSPASNDTSTSIIVNGIKMESKAVAGYTKKLTCRVVNL